MQIFSPKNNKKNGFTHTLNKFSVTPKGGGFMLVEVLVAVSIITAAVLATMTVAQKSIQVSRQALHTAQVAFLLEEGAEAVRIVRDSAWTNISSFSLDTDYYPVFSSNTWSLSSTPNTVGDFTRIVRLTSVNRDDTTKDISETGTIDPDTKLVTVNVAWVEGGTTATKTLQFYIMKIF
jgi:Tfp pilus assembly protein PilV